MPIVLTTALTNFQLSDGSRVAASGLTLSPAVDNSEYVYYWMDYFSPTGKFNPVYLHVRAIGDPAVVCYLDLNGDEFSIKGNDSLVIEISKAQRFSIIMPKAGQTMVVKIRLSDNLNYSPGYFRRNIYSEQFTIRAHFSWRGYLNSYNGGASNIFEMVPGGSILRSYNSGVADLTLLNYEGGPPLWDGRTDGNDQLVFQLSTILPYTKITALSYRIGFIARCDRWDSGVITAGIDKALRVAPLTTYSRENFNATAFTSPQQFYDTGRLGRDNPAYMAPGIRVPVFGELEWLPAGDAVFPFSVQSTTQSTIFITAELLREGETP